MSDEKVVGDKTASAGKPTSWRGQAVQVAAIVPSHSLGRQDRWSRRF